MADAKTTRRRRWWALGLALAILLLLGDYFLYPLLPHAGGQRLDRGENGLWLRYTWYFGQWQEADLARVCRWMREGRIRDAYCFYSLHRSVADELWVSDRENCRKIVLSAAEGSSTWHRRVKLRTP